MAKPPSSQKPGGEIKRRDVLKPVLDNPYAAGSEWPQLESAVASQILDHLTSSLSQYGKYLELTKNEKNLEKLPPKPIVADKITMGFNSTVKKLELQAAPNRDKVMGKRKKNSKEEGVKRVKTGPEETSETASSYVKYVFIAKSDIYPTILTECFPLLTFSASRSLKDRVKLVELPKGAMSRLSTCLNTENTGIISLEEDWAEGRALYDLIDKYVVDVEVPWLAGIFDCGIPLEPVFQKPRIKFLKTSAPIGKLKVDQKKRARQVKESERKRIKTEGKDVVHK